MLEHTDYYGNISPEEPSHLRFFDPVLRGPDEDLDMLDMKEDFACFRENEIYEENDEPREAAREEGARLEAPRNVLGVALHFEDRIYDRLSHHYQTEAPLLKAFMTSLD